MQDKDRAKEELRSGMNFSHEYDFGTTTALTLKCVSEQKGKVKGGKKRIHVSEFENEVFSRFNEVRRLRGIMQIEKKEHLETAISRIWQSVSGLGRELRRK